MQKKATADIPGQLVKINKTQTKAFSEVESFRHLPKVPAVLMYFLVGQCFPNTRLLAVRRVGSVLDCVLLLFVVFHTGHKARENSISS